MIRPEYPEKPFKKPRENPKITLIKAQKDPK
jgi:hypothetical protein